MMFLLVLEFIKYLWKIIGLLSIYHNKPPPCSVKAVESTTAPSSGNFKQYTLLNRLSDAVKAQTKPSDDAMIIDEPEKPVAGSSKHPDDMDIIDSELIY